MAKKTDGCDVMILKTDRKRILVADDDEGFLGATRTILEVCGYRVETAMDGEEALRKIRKHVYDMVILDVIMPKIEGSKLFRMIRKSKRYKHVPVLLISGYPVWTELEERKRDIIRKADAYIQKPFQTKALLETVRVLSGGANSVRR